MTGVDRFVYRMRNTGDSSSKFGPCEVCNRPVSEVFLQTEGRVYEDGGQDAITHHETTQYFGHRECLIGQQRYEIQVTEVSK